MAMQTFKVVSANIFDGAVSTINPVVNDDSLHSALTSWIDKQGRHWPAELTASYLAEHLKLIYLPYWIVCGQGTAQWSATIGVERKVPQRCRGCGGRGRYTLPVTGEEKRCSTCGGSGRVIEPETFWSSQTGFVEAQLQYHAVENYDKSFKLACGSRDFAAKRHWLEADTSRYRVLQPNFTDKEAGQNVAYEAMLIQLRKSARGIGHRMGKVQDLQIANAQVGDLSTEFSLYPIYTGMYKYRGEKLLIEVDAVTQVVGGVLPESVKRARSGDYYIAIGIIIFIVTVLSFCATFIVVISQILADLI